MRRCPDEIAVRRCVSCNQYFTSTAPHSVTPRCTFNPTTLHHNSIVKIFLTSRSLTRQNLPKWLKQVGYESSIAVARPGLSSVHTSVVLTARWKHPFPMELLRFSYKRRYLFVSSPISTLLTLSFHSCRPSRRFESHGYRYIRTVLRTFSHHNYLRYLWLRSER